MSLNIVIGIGGTGAKVVESILHGAAAGLGPDQLLVGFVDQDKSNGNISRAQEALAAIITARSNWRTEGGDHYYASSDLLRTSVDSPERVTWTPHPDQNTTLAGALGDLSGDEALLNLLFKPDASEQGMDLGIGYQGKAHVGSAAITAAVSKSDETFWKTIFDRINSAKSGTTVRLILAGSVFGGTGAAGFPTIARLIRRHVGRDKNFRLGGVLMLPYFAFDPPSEGSTVARSEDLLVQTRGALRYYEALRAQEQVFDDVFLTGWDTYFALGYHQPGTLNQRNPALLPELIAALAALRFFNNDYEPRGQIQVSARREPSAINWDDLPSPIETDGTLPYRKLGAQIRYAAAWKHWWPVLSKEGGNWKPSFRRYSWYRRYGLGRLDAAGTQVSQAVTAMNAYTELFIEWAASIQAYSQRNNLDFGLWDVLPLLSEPVNFGNPTRPISVRSRLDEEAYANASRIVVRGRTPADRLTDGAWLLRELSSGTPGEKDTGLGSVVSALHRLSATTDASSKGAADERL